jgi:hypothetical protein
LIRENFETINSAINDSSDSSRIKHIGVMNSIDILNSKQDESKKIAIGTKELAK